MPQARIEKAMQYTNNVLHNTYHIFLMNFLIGQAPTKSKANTFCRAANRMLRTMGPLSAISASAMGEALTSWLTRAATADNGVTPPINTIT